MVVQRDGVAAGLVGGSGTRKPRLLRIVEAARDEGEEEKEEEEEEEEEKCVL